MSNYTKKKMGLILLMIGLGLIGAYIMFLREEFKNDEVKQSLSSLLIVALIVGILLVIFSIILFATIPSKNSIKTMGEKGYCTILKIESSHSASGRGVRTSFYFLVEFKASDGSIAKEGVRCSLDDMNKYKAGTKLSCYIKGRSIYVPRPFEVIENNAI